MSLPRGAFAPVPTPVGDDGLFDGAALGRHLELVRRGGLDGVLVMGTNGEFPSFDLNERLAVADAAARWGDGVDLMLGVGSCALPEARQLVRSAHHLGFGSALLPPPFYYRNAPVRGLIAFIEAVLDVAELPVLLYHIPQVTGIAITDEVVDAVLDHPRFGGIKDSSGSEEELARFTAALSNRSYMVGNDRLLTLCRLSGGAGSITAAASVVPELVAATHRDNSRQPALDAVRGLLERYGLGPAVKAILRHRGVGSYRTRAPLLCLDDTESAALVREFDELTGWSADRRR
jgi:4-hydroxy-tetrahydrodipicolinate synthase